MQGSRLFRASFLYLQVWKALTSCLRPRHDIREIECKYLIFYLFQRAGERQERCQTSTQIRLQQGKLNLKFNL